MSGTNVYTYTHDVTKNIMETLDLRGNVSIAYSYDVFGLAENEGILTSGFQFSSEHYDYETGCLYYNFRHYNPLDGVWIGRDPKEELAFQVCKLQGSEYEIDATTLFFNSSEYGFVLQNPLSLFDNLGLSTEISCRNCRICLDPPNSGDGQGYHVHWNCGIRGKLPVTCRINGKYKNTDPTKGAADLLTGKGRENSGDMPPKIRDCIREKTAWEKRAKAYYTEKKNCCVEHTATEYVATAATAVVVGIVVYKVVKGCGGAIIGFFVAGPPGAVYGLAVGLAT